MESIKLNGIWQMNQIGTDKKYEAQVPTTMYQVLYENGEIPDPFVGENDKILTNVSDDDYEFSRDFEVNKSILENDVIELVFYGLDTLATVWLNDKKILTSDNMHRTYEIEVKSLLVEGCNSLRVKLDSPMRYIKEKQARDPLWGIENPVDGYEHIRKAHHMFGWDWGPQLPDMGIWRDVELNAYCTGRIDDFYISQKHTDEAVAMSVEVECSLYQKGGLELQIDLYDCNQNEVYSNKIIPSEHNELEFVVNNPDLWWPNGYGEQPLYTLRMSLVDSVTNDVIQMNEKCIGLRTMTMTREADQWGESFDMTVNGVRIFAMGADYIPEDVLICRMNEGRTRQLLEDCATANFNHIRVWGGAFYPSDNFYDLCDELGLLVWQDFMFACGVYRLTKKFEETITMEIINNVKRIRHHACLGLWCGNNEMEWGFVEWGLPKDENLRLDYLRMYERLIPDILEAHDPNTFYWPASPSSGGGFDNPNGDDKGDVHYWDVFHNNKHYKTFRKHYFRFASEYGMQSLPDMKTISGFAEANEREIYAPVMENHNKCLGEINGNMKIMMNMATEFNLPNNLEDVVYLSQVFQGETIRCAVEHMRRNRGRCMGSTFWQVNDNWPVASWASIDVHGRWKALHYMVRRFYDSVHTTAYEDGFKGHIHICNEQLTRFEGELSWQIRHNNKGVVKQATLKVDVEELSASKIASVDISDYCTNHADERDYYLSYQLKNHEGEMLGSDIMLFVNHKYFNFSETNLSANVIVVDDQIQIEVKATEMAKSVGIEFSSIDVLLSDNYFDLLPGEIKVVTVEAHRNDVVKGGVDKVYSSEQIANDLRLKAINTLTYI